MPQGTVGQQIFPQTGQSQQLGPPQGASTQQMSPQAGSSQPAPSSGSGTGPPPPAGFGSAEFGQTGFGEQVLPQSDELSVEDTFSRFFRLQGITSRLQQYGYNFFDYPVSSFAPVMDVPVGPDYIVGPDDTLSINVWNVPDANFNRNYIVAVERDGKIFIPQVGPIPVAGQTFSEANRSIKTRLAQILKRIELHVSMARLRTIKVYVVGEVVRPGAYEISSLATASNAIYAACGPAKSGSLRKIKIVRDGNLIAELDFYRFLLKGDRTQDVRLQSGDTIVIPPIGEVAAIGGPVRRPAIYELKERMMLRDLIDLAGGLGPTADRTRCQVFRIVGGKTRVILDVDLVKAQALKTSVANGNGEDPLVQDGDFVKIVTVPNEIENFVTLAGTVKTPGPYEDRPGMRILDVLTPDQILVDAYQERAELIRTDPVTYTTAVIPFSPKQLLQGTPEENHQLRRLDKIMVSSQFRIPGSVRVMGEVRRPGVYTIELGERLSAVLKRTGGFTERAFPQGLVLVRESVKSGQQAELQRFVTTQKQQLLAESARLTAGSLSKDDAAGPQSAVAIRMQQLDTLLALVQPGRIVIKMDTLEKFEGSPDDVILENGDQITIPQPPQTVSIIGSVRNPTSVVYRQGWTLENYLNQAGGPSDDANKKEIYVIRANGATDIAYLNLKEMRPGDTIVVPPKTEPKTKTLPLVQAAASILGSLSLTGASLAVIGR
jgi:polysaccharide export outer membrane protein